MSNERFVKDVVKEAYQSWTAEKPVIISAPTGSRKTTFILNELLRYAMTQDPGRKILYLVNRTALLDQLQHEVKKRQDAIDAAFNGSVDIAFDFWKSCGQKRIEEYLRIITYHNLGTLEIPDQKCNIPQPKTLRVSEQYHPDFHEPMYHEETAEYKKKKSLDQFLSNIYTKKNDKITYSHTPQINDKPSPYAVPDKFPPETGFYMANEHLMTNQKVGSPSQVKANNKKNNNIETVEFLFDASYIVLDESHFFLADAEFNGSIPQIVEKLKTIKKINPNAVWIYLTATPSYLYIFLNHFLDKTAMEDIYPRSFHNFDICNSIHIQPNIASLLLYKESPDSTIEQYKQMQRDRATIADFPCFLPVQSEDYFTNYFSNQYAEFNTMRKQIDELCQTFTIDPDYSYIDPIYFHNNQDLMDLIAYAPKNEKWIIFVSNNRDAEDLGGKLSELHIENAYVTAENKSKPGSINAREYQKIIRQETYSVRVLIATSALDNGININDPDVKNIVILNLNQTIFQQMLGRKRIINSDQTDNNRVKLYIRSIPWNQFENHYKNSLLDILANIQNYLLSYHKKYSHSSSKNAALSLRDMTYAEFVTILDPNIERYLHYNDSSPREFIPETIAYFMMKLAYDYYQISSFFEKEYNRRNPALQYHAYTELYKYLPDQNHWLVTNQSRKGATVLPRWYKDYENKLKANSYLSLKLQLSWINLQFNGPEDVLHPVHTENWFGKKSGHQDRILEAIKTILEIGGRLPPVMRDNLIKHLKAYYRSVEGQDSRARAEFQLKLTNKCLRELGLPYKIRARPSTENGETETYWIVDRTEIMN